MSPLIAHTLAAHLRLHIQGHAKEIHELCENSTNTRTCYSGGYIPTQCVNHASSERKTSFHVYFSSTLSFEILSPLHMVFLYTALLMQGLHETFGDILSIMHTSHKCSK
jgi:hypothetical protein